MKGVESALEAWTGKEDPTLLSRRDAAFLASFSSGSGIERRMLSVMPV